LPPAAGPSATPPTADDRAYGKWTHARSALLDLIDDLPPGQPLPPERQLARQLRVARMTLRKAIDELVATERLVRRPGRGTFVAPPKLSYPENLTSFSHDMRRRGHRPSSRTESFGTEPADPTLAARLNVSPGTPVITAVRVRLGDGEPLGVERLHVVAARVPGLTAADLEQHSFYELLESRWGIRRHSGARISEATCCTEEEARLLGVAPYSPAFSFERTTYDADGQVIEYVTSTYRGDRYRFVARFGPEDTLLRSSDPVMGDVALRHGDPW
jgi:GntR family transcriptional regulator